MRSYRHAVAGLRRYPVTSRLDLKHCRASSILGDLRAIGHGVFYDGEGERIMPTGAHAGIIGVKRYAITPDDVAEL